MEGWITLHPETRITTENYGTLPIREIRPGINVLTPLGWREVAEVNKHYPVLYFYYIEFTNDARIAGSRFLILTVDGEGLRRITKVNVGDKIKANKSVYTIRKKIIIRETIPMYFLRVYSRGNEFFLSNGVLISHRENL